MIWQLKALLQSVFSNVPLGEKVNYFFQRHVTQSLPTDVVKCATIVGFAQEHLAGLQAHLSRPIREATFFEFGAGWDLIIPLAYYALGISRQIVVDIRKLLRPDLVDDAISKLSRLAPGAGLVRVPDRTLSSAHGSEAIALLNQYYGIDYRAPCDARRTNLPSSSIDCITSTNTLEHISPPDIQAILRECARILRDTGFMSFRIDYQDHYSYFDNSISAYNFLKYSDRIWALFNPALHYQNRLRHRDYLDAFDAAGFEVVAAKRVDGTSADLAVIEQLPLAGRFRRYPPSELAVRYSLVVLRKR